jgi:hypothetical protein
MREYHELETLLHEATAAEHLSEVCASCELKYESIANAYFLREKIEFNLNKIIRMEQSLSDTDYAYSLSLMAEESEPIEERLRDADYALSLSLVTEETEPSTSTISPMIDETSWVFPKRFVRLKQTGINLSMKPTQV